MLLTYSQYNNTSHQHIGISILKSTIARQIIPSGELTGFNLMDMTGNFVKLTPIHSPSKWSADSVPGLLSAQPERSAIKVSLKVDKLQPKGIHNKLCPVINQGVSHLSDHRCRILSLQFYHDLH